MNQARFGSRAYIRRRFALEIAKWARNPSAASRVPLVAQARGRRPRRSVPNRPIAGEPLTG
jgi:hypothetical protein